MSLEHPSPRPLSSPTDDVTSSYDAVVVGAGFAGLYMLIRLRELGLSARVFEAASDVGGTWWWNRYPGARCDVESMDYSYSFSKELEQEWHWSERYSPQPEILRYASHVAERFDLRRDIQFDTRVTSAVYDEAAKRWLICTDRGDRVSARFSVMATGCLSISKKPEVEGLDAFEGRVYHTGHWPHEGVNFTGQRVGIIGTGSSAIQSIPIIAAEAAHLTVFQRTPNFSLPAHNAALAPEVERAMKARYQEHRQQARESGFGVPAAVAAESALEVDEGRRAETYEAGWQRGSLVAMLLSYSDLLANKEANDTAAEFIREKIRTIVADPAVAETLCPTDHPFGTKRPCLDSGYYATFNRPNVRLIDLRKTPIEAFVAKGVRTSEEVVEIDSLVLATGFDAMTGALTAIDIRGRRGCSLRQKWEGGTRTYLGLAVAGFPNLFMITGPGSPSVFSNMMVSIEQHVDWIAACLQYLQQHDLRVIDATSEAEEAWVEHVREVGEATLFPRANSWYMGSNVPGKARMLMPYIGGVGEYRQRCDQVAASGYEGFVLEA